MLDKLVTLAHIYLALIAWVAALAVVALVFWELWTMPWPLALLGTSIIVALGVLVIGTYAEDY